MKYKSKIFSGSFGHGNKSADEKFNDWMEENPNILIFDVKYQQARYGDHSIFILYVDADEIKKKELESYVEFAKSIYDGRRDTARNPL